MAYYNDPRRTAIPQIQPGAGIPGSSPYLQIPDSSALASQGLGFAGGARNSFSGIPRAATFPAHSMAGQQYLQPQYLPQAAPQTAAGYGTSPAAQYIAATQAAAAQQAGLVGQNPYAASQPGMAGTGVPVPGAHSSFPGAHSFPGTSGQYYGGQGQYGDVLPPHQQHHRHGRKHKKSRIRKIVEEILAGGAGVAAAHYEEKKHRRSRANSETTPNAPNVEHPPKGSAPGFLHPKGHFVPGAIDDLADHFLHKKGNIAPEGSQPGYLHSGGHFVSMAIEALVAEFAHTILKEHRRHRGRSHTPTGQRHHETRSSNDSSSSGSDYSDSDSDTSSASDEDHGHHRHSGNARR